MRHVLLFAVAILGCSGGDRAAEGPVEGDLPDVAAGDDAVVVDSEVIDAETTADAAAPSEEDAHPANDSGLAADTRDAAPISADAAVPDPSWSCASSSYASQQWWTCAGGAIHRCDGGVPVKIDCALGCVVGPPGTHDACNTSKPALAMPTVVLIIKDGLFAESAVRKPIEDGLRYELDRMQRLVALDGKTPPAKITITYSASSATYCSGIAYSTSTELACPRGYPITGSNQNYVVNITLHEIGHILAAHLLASPSVRDTCTNEGVASWIAGKYWMNAASKPVSSLRAAAQHEIAIGRASATMSNCVSASDAWYKIYASYFEYLELFVPDGVRAVSTGKLSKSVHEPAWREWLRK